MRPGCKSGTACRQAYARRGPSEPRAKRLNRAIAPRRGGRAGVGRATAARMPRLAATDRRQQPWIALEAQGVSQGLRGHYFFPPRIKAAAGAVLRNIVV